MDRLQDIYAAIEHFEAEASHGRAAFEADPTITVASPIEQPMNAPTSSLPRVQ